MMKCNNQDKTSSDKYPVSSVLVLLPLKHACVSIAWFMYLIIVVPLIIRTGDFHVGTCNIHESKNKKKISVSISGSHERLVEVFGTGLFCSGRMYVIITTEIHQRFSNDHTICWPSPDILIHALHACVCPQPLHRNDVYIPKTYG